MEKSNNIHIGHCVSPHGIRGEFSFVLYEQKDSILQNEMEVLLVPKSSSSSLPPQGKSFTIKKINFGNKVIVSLDEIANRNIVESMVPFDIFINRIHFPEIDEDEYYLNDLLGLEVFDFLTKNYIGTVEDLYENGVQVVLKIKTENTLLEILFIDQYVPEVDIENNKIFVIIPEMVE